MSDVYILLMFFLAIAVLVTLIAKFKIHPVPTLFIVVVALGLALGMGTGTIDLVQEGFGNTLTSVGLLVIWGCVLGKMLELSGAAMRITDSALTLFKDRKIPWGIALASTIVGIPLVADTVVVMLIPIVSVIAARTGRSMMVLGPILYMGAYVMTSVVPPGPGPLASAALLNVDFGQAILFGLAVGVPGIVAAVLYLLTIRTKVAPLAEYVQHLDASTPETTATRGPGAAAAPGSARRSNPAPAAQAQVAKASETGITPTAGLGLTESLIPILAPIVLIMLSSFVSPLLGESPVASVLDFIGTPTVALFLACLMALPLFRRQWHDKKVVNGIVEQGLRMAAMFLALTGIGGSLALIIRETSVAENIAAAIEAAHMPPIIIPFLVAAVVCTITGSNILGVMTAAAMMEPLLPTLGLEPLAVYLACATGAQIMKHPNSSGWWITTTMSNMTVGQGIRSTGVASLISGITGFAVLNILMLTGVV